MVNIYFTIFYYKKTKKVNNVVYIKTIYLTKILLNDIINLNWGDCVEIVLKSIDDKNIKCTCEICDGSGIEVIEKTKGVICSNCSGKGYYFYQLESHEQFFQDYQSQNMYIVEDGIIKEYINVKPFKGLKILDNVVDIMIKNKYNGKVSNSFSYKDFLKGYLPRLYSEYGCPSEFLNQYNELDFCEKCQKCNTINGCSRCDKYENRDECWEAFYNFSEIEIMRSKRKTKIK